MTDLAFYLLMGTPQGGGAEGGGAGLMTFLPFVAIIAIFYFLIIRPQSRKQKETQKMLSTLRKGDKVITVGGIHGTIQTVREHSIIVKVDANTKIEFSRSAVSSIVSPGSEKEDKAEEKEADEDSESDSEK